MNRKTISVGYSEKDDFFDLVEGVYRPKEWCKKMNLHPFLYPDAYIPHLETKHRYSIWVGGNGSAKSTSKAKRFIQKSLEKGHFRLLFLRHNHSDNRSTTFLLFKGIIEKEGLTDEFNILESPMTFECKSTGNMMVSGGLDQTGKFSGLEDFTDIWFEEPITRSDGKIRMISHEQFEDLDSRLRMPNAKLTLHTTLNPISKQFFMYKGIFDPEIDTDPKKKANRVLTYDEIDYCHTTYKDNPFLPDSAVTVIEKFKGSRAEYGREGRWAEEKTGNEWIADFNRDIHVKSVGYLIDREIHSTFDFNLLPYQTNLLGQILRKQSGVLQVRIFKEYCLTPPLNTPENACKFAIEDFIKTYGYNIFSVYGDASGRYGYDAYRGIFDILEPYTHNDSDQVLRKNPFVRMARDLLNEILRGEYPDIELVIDESCVNLILDLETLQTAPDGFDNEKDKSGVERKGHCYSALIYFLAVIFSHLLKQNKGKS